MGGSAFSPAAVWIPTLSLVAIGAIAIWLRRGALAPILALYAVLAFRITRDLPDVYFTAHLPPSPEKSARLMILSHSAAALAIGLAVPLLIAILRWRLLRRGEWFDAAGPADSDTGA